MSKSFERAAHAAIDKAVNTLPVDRAREMERIPETALKDAREMMRSQDPDQREALREAIWEKALASAKTRTYGHPNEPGPKKI